MPRLAVCLLSPIAAADSFVNVGWWFVFGLFIAVLVGVDLLVIHRKGHEPSMAMSA